jgi:hypothetical protein
MGKQRNMSVPFYAGRINYPIVLAIAVMLLVFTLALTKVAGDQIAAQTKAATAAVKLSMHKPAPRHM